jgi:phospholipase/carboxylesterase
LSDSHGLDFQLREPAGEPQGALVLLHGRGADEHDLKPLIEYLDPDRRLVAVTPGGPLNLPPGGRHWYVVERVGYPDPDTFKSSYALLEQWLDDLPEQIGVGLERTVIGGFSQGSVMAYTLSLGRGRQSPAGVVALSGFIPTVAGFDIELEGREGLAVAIGHGSLDPVIPVEFGRQAAERLAAAGLAVNFRESPIGHGIDPSLVDELASWLTETLNLDSR